MSDDDSWETVSEHTVESGDEAVVWQVEEIEDDADNKEGGGGGGKKKKKDKKEEAAPESAAPGCGGQQPQGAVPSAEELAALVKEEVERSAEAGLKTVAAAIRAAHPDWTVGEARLRKVLSEVKGGGAKPPLAPGDLKPLSLDQDGRIAGIQGMDFSFRSFHGAFDPSDAQVMAKLVADCHVACRAQSFWLSAAAKPRFELERMARSVFDLHTQGLSTQYNPNTSGVEWWVHFRGPQARDGEAIGFHWDRDEAYADLTRQNVHPHVATVTYLSDNGAPTMILEQLPIAKGTSNITQAYLSHPKLGKHVSFDGRLLHGVPPELMASHAEKKHYTRITVRAPLLRIWFLMVWGVQSHSEKRRGPRNDSIKSPCAVPCIKSPCAVPCIPRSPCTIAIASTQALSSHKLRPCGAAVLWSRVD